MAIVFAPSARETATSCSRCAARAAPTRVDHQHETGTRPARRHGERANRETTSVFINRMQLQPRPLKSRCRRSSGWSTATRLAMPGVRG
jgi:hypothetical protein